MKEKEPKIIKQFNTSKKPQKPSPFLMPVEWAGTTWFTFPVGAKINKHGCEDLKPPYLLLCSHASFIDFPIAVKATFPHRTNWLMSIENFIGKEWVMRGIGGIYRRRFTADVMVVRHILKVLRKDKSICTIYPEARYSIAGTNENIDESIGALAKAAKCPVVALISHGNFIHQPQWSMHPKRSVPVSADMTQIVTAEECKTLSADEIQARIEKAFVYDDYKWQKDNNIHVTCKKRAHNIHKILYQCPACGTEYSTDSKDSDIWCNSCGKRWRMTELGEMKCLNGKDIFTHVPDWYRWERENVRNEIRSGNYHFEVPVRLEHLDNAKIGFTKLGTVNLIQDETGLTLDGLIDEGLHFKLHRSAISMQASHIEYDFHGKGDLIDISTQNDTYFAYPLTKKCVITKLNLAAEELYIYHKELEAAKKAAKDADTDDILK